MKPGRGRTTRRLRGLQERHKGQKVDRSGRWQLQGRQPSAQSPCGNVPILCRLEEVVKASANAWVGARSGAATVSDHKNLVRNLPRAAQVIDEVGREIQARSAIARSPATSLVAKLRDEADTTLAAYCHRTIATIA